MANEKRTTIAFQIQTAGVLYPLAVSSQADLTGDVAARRQQIAVGSWQALDIGTLASIERVACKNLDATNYVEFALDNAGAKIFAKVVAGDGFHLPCAAGTTALYARANTAACWIAFVACEP